MVVSPQTINRTLQRAGLFNFRAAKREVLTLRHRNLRLQFAINAIEWPLFSVYKICFLDEVAVDNVFDYAERVWRERGQRYAEEYLQEIRRSGRLSVKFVCAILWTGETYVEPLFGTLDGPYFKEILSNRLVPWIREKMQIPDIDPDGYEWCILMDNASPHIARCVREWVTDNIPGQVKYLSPKSPDFNVIEKCFALTKREIPYLGPRPQTELEIINRFFEAWEAKVQVSTIQGLYNSFQPRLLEAIKNNGGHTIYW